MLKMPVFLAVLLGIVTVALNYFFFSGIERTGVALLFSAGFLLVSVAVMVSGFQLMRFGEDVESTAGFSLVVLGGLHVCFIAISSPVALLLQQYVPCLGYTLSLQAALTLWLVILHAYLWFGVRDWVRWTR